MSTKSFYKHVESTADARHLSVEKMIGEALRLEQLFAQKGATMYFRESSRHRRAILESV